MLKLDQLTPKEIVEALDKYIIGQKDAKKAVALALRNRLRRQKLPQELIEEVYPKNIIMIGSTGVGKTEIARRLSKLSGAPFVKVEATKYTEVGYVGRDVESMVRDLMGVSMSMVKTEMQEKVKDDAAQRVEELLLDLLLPGTKPKSPGPVGMGTAVDIPSNDTREKFRTKLRAGDFEDKKVEILASSRSGPQIEIFSGSNFEEMDMNLGGALGGMLGGNKKKKRSVKIRQAREILLAEEMEKLVDQDQVLETAKDRVENMGIIFIDEIDKIASRQSTGTSGDVSREGVQRDILPIVEGSKVNTKQGIVDTSHILFIAAGAFHMSKPSDLIPELQGRFPIRVELEDLTVDDFERILTQPKNSLVLQYVELMKTEGVTLDFTPEGIRRLSEIAAEANKLTQNIGARRLHTVMELLLEEVSFSAPEISGQTITITAEYVDQRLGDIIKDQDLSRYIL
jgi:ATP-dependent HslUV protease ATP-binding subunit HslU